MKAVRVQLRPPEWSDMDFIRLLWGDVETMAAVGGPIHLTNDKAERWFRRMIDPGSSDNCYRLILNDDGQPVGEVSFHRLNAESMTGEFNIKVLSTQRGRGYAQEAISQFLDYFFNDLDGCVMVDRVATANRLGQRALLRFGFEHDPSVKDVFMLRMTRERFNELYG